MIEKNDWQGVEDFVTDHPDALTTNIGELGFKSILHVIGDLLVDVESDEATFGRERKSKGLLSTKTLCLSLLVERKPKGLNHNCWQLFMDSNVITNFVF